MSHSWSIRDWKTLMTNSMPGPDGPGLFINSYTGVELETHLALARQGTVVRYWNESLCLAQTAVYNDTVLGHFLELVYVVTPHRLLQHCISLDCYPVEYLFLRDCMEVEQWSLVMARIRPEVLAVCFMAQYDLNQYRSLVLTLPLQEMMQDPVGHAYGEEIYAQINAQAEAYAKTLAEGELKLGGQIGQLNRTSLMRLLMYYQDGRLNLRELFALTYSPAKDAATLMMSRARIYHVALCHMATFNPATLRDLYRQLGTVIDPTQPGADKAEHEQQQRLVARVMTDYVQAQETALKQVPVETGFSDSDFKALFNLNR